MESYLIQAAKEYNVGDRVRVYVEGKEFPKGTKGNVEFVREGTIGVLFDGVDGKVAHEFYTAPELEIVASHGEMERTKEQYDLKWVGINQPEQLLEIEDKIRQEVEIGKGYLDIEKFLMGMGYGVNLIRRGFKKLYGISAEQATNYEGWMDSPGNIPQYTMAWGYAKKGKDVYFLMPGVNWYSVLCQKDDMNRVEVSKHMTLDEAVVAIEKLVKQLERYCPAVKDLKLPKKGEGTDATQFNKNPQIWTQADAEKKMQEEAVMEQLGDIEKETMKRPIKEELTEKTPKQFFERKKIEQRYAMLPANVVNSISEYLAQASARLQDFDLSVASFKYTSIQPSEGASKSTSMDEPDIMNATASVSVLLEITDKRSESGVNKKLGLMVFSIVQNNVFTSDVLKGEDDVPYALTDEGLQNYFRTERGVGGNQ